MLRSPSSGALPPLPAKPASASNLQNTLSPPANQQRPNSVPLESAAGGVSDPANPLYLSNGAGSVGKAAAGTGGLGGVGELLVTTPLLTAAETSPADSARESEADAASLQGARSGSRPGALTPTGGARSNSRSPLYARVSRSSSQPDITAPTGLRRASVASGAPDAEKKPAAAAAAAASASGASGAMVKQGSFLRKPAASSVAAALSGLTELNVSDQALQACPDLGPYLSSLITLDISRNQIQALHKSFERLSSLTALKASQNILKEIPSTIGRITSLEYLDFSSNIITQCPSSIGWLENLSTLLLQNNQLAKLPADLEKCRKLDNLEIAGNRLLSVPTFILRNTVGLGRDFIEEVIPLETMNGMKASHKSLSERAKKAMERASGLEQQVSSLLDAQRGAEGELAKLRTQLGDIQHKAESLEKAARAEAAERERLVADAAASVERFMRELQQTEASLKAERNEVQSLSAKLVAIEERIRESRVEGYRPDDDGALPPTGNVTLVFTDIQGSTAQWESNAKLMAAALKQHNRLMRARIKAWKGYEVKTEGDAFMIAFASALEAIRFCLDVQVQLTKEEWDPELLKNPESAVEEDEAGSLLWRGLRVRMGCHTGEPSCEPDPTTRRMDYFGPMVNRAARVEGICHGGQITVSGSAMKALEGHMAELKKEAVFKPLGEVQLKGLETPEAITQCLPRALGKRAFPPVGKATAAESATEQIKEMQSKNEAILEKLRAMESVVENVRGDADGLASRLRRFRGGGGASKDAASTAAITEAVAKFESLMGTISKLRQEVGDEVRESRGFRDHSRETEKKALRQLKAENERLAATNQQLTLRLANAEEHSRQNAAMKADLKRLQAESERLSRALEAKAGEAEALAAEVKRRDALLSDTEGKSKEKSEYIQGAVFEIRELEAELARTKAKVFAAAGEKLEAERTAAALKEELEEVRGRLDPVERGREAAHGDLAAARARLAQLEEEVKGHEERLELATVRYSKELTALRGDLHERTREATRGRGEALRAQEALKAAQAELSALRAEAATLRAASAALAKDLEAAHAANRDLEREKRERVEVAAQLDQKNAVLRAVSQERVEKAKELGEAVEEARRGAAEAARERAVSASLKAALQAAEAARQVAEGEAEEARAGAQAAREEAAALRATVDAAQALVSEESVRPARDALLAKRGLIAELKELLQFYVREHRLETPAQAQELARALRAVMAKYLDPAERLLLGLSPMDGAGTGGGGPGPGSKPANASSVSAANSKAGGRPGSASPTPGPGPAAAQRKTLAPSGSRASIAR